jgi:hypothetical protein
MRWLILIGIFLLNIVGVFFALAPGLVSWAQVVPAGIDCSLCAKPEVREALIRAAAAGRAEILAPMQSGAWIVLTVAALNILVVGLLIWRLRSNNRWRGP